MAEKKIHKKEAPNETEPTPQEKKIKDLRGTGLSLREISEKLNISRKKVEEALAIKPAASTKQEFKKRK